MSDHYSLDVIIGMADAFRFTADEKDRVSGAYLTAHREYDSAVPYDSKRLPGVDGLRLHRLNGEVRAFGVARKELFAIVEEIQRGSV